MSSWQDQLILLLSGVRSMRSAFFVSPSLRGMKRESYHRQRRITMFLKPANPSHRVECKMYAAMKEQHRQLHCAWKLPIVDVRLLLTLSVSVGMSRRPLSCQFTPVAFYAPTVITGSAYWTGVWTRPKTPGVHRSREA